MVNNGSCSYATVVNPESCVGCGNCVDVCKTHAIELITE
ncbi:4Fe-4S binding protein [Parabacteroides goldsteinii]|nr:4Fe-4S binding protein [Parabacteroides goldsteinii]MCM0711943.1 4Fe-4S binding protein [Parabacteroides sp. TA-V-105]MCM0721949.1 4Fe-4S binding protein [Parabacteroides sp. W1-Q-101]